jgi:hypothetical protein
MWLRQMLEKEENPFLKANLTTDASVFAIAA